MGKILLFVLYILVPGILPADTLTPRSSSQVGNSFLGIQSNLNFVGRVPNSNDYFLMDKLAETGVKWVRYWLNWYQVEVDSGVYNFTAADSVINGYTSRGMNVFITLCSGNQWYDGPDSSVYDTLQHPEMGLSPTPGSVSMQGWLEFVDTAVTRYQGKIKYWGIWNEPNLAEYWQPGPNPSHYANLLKLTSQKIKSIDGSAKIIALGVSTVDLNYISNVLQEDVLKDVDYIGFHPYRYYPEDDQDNMGLPYPASPFQNFKEELQALKDTVAKYDTTGKIGLWDEEAGYPSHPEVFIWTPGNIYSSDTTQVKYLLRRYFLNLGMDVKMTTWFYDYDQISAYPSILGPTWYQHYYDTDWYAKESAFLFNYLGITYASPADTLVFEAENYDSIYAPLKNGTVYLYTNDGDGDYQGSAVYNINIPDSGLYTIWLRLYNNDETACFIFSVDGSGPYWVTNGNAAGTGTQFIWSLSLDAELIRWNYLIKGVRFFNLSAGNHKLRVTTGTDGSHIDKIIVKREAPDLTLKPAYYALQKLASVFDDRIIPDSGVNFVFENIDVPSTDWGDFYNFTFKDTANGSSFIVYWLGIKGTDNSSPGYHTKLTLNTDSTVNPRIINFIDGTVTAVTDFEITDSTIVFDSLVVSDFPYCLAFDYPVGVGEKGKQARISYAISPNPFKNDATISYTLPLKGKILLRLYDVSGRCVKTLVDGIKEQGEHKEELSGKEFKTGIYFVKFEAGGYKETRKLILMR